jgi:hypothetical protein
MAGVVPKYSDVIADSGLTSAAVFIIAKTTFHQFGNVARVSVVPF